MKFLLLIFTLLVSFSAKAILVCPELQGLYECAEPIPMLFSIAQYENNENAMVYEIFNASFIADGKTYVTYEDKWMTSAYKAECDYSELKITHNNYNLVDGSSWGTEMIITRINQSRFSFKTILVDRQPEMPDEITQQKTTCKLH